MRREFSDLAKAMFVERFSGRAEGFAYVKSRKTFVPGAAVFERCLDKTRKAWITFHGFRENYFSVCAGWTLSGMDPKTLPEWRLDAHQMIKRNFPAPPDDGFIDLRERYRFFADGDPYFVLELPEPDAELQQRGLEAYLQSEEFEAEVQKSYRGALLIYKKNPPDLDSVRADSCRAEIVYRRLWPHLIDRKIILPEEIEALVSPVVAYAVEIACQHGLPFLQRRLGL